MRSLLFFLEMLRLHHDLWHWDKLMEEEQQRYDSYHERMAKWRFQRQLVLDRIAECREAQDATRTTP